MWFIACCFLGNFYKRLGFKLLKFHLPLTSARFLTISWNTRQNKSLYSTSSHLPWISHQMFVKALMWIVSLGLIALCVYMPYDYTKEDGVTSSSWNADQRAAFETLSKTAWAIAVGWIVYAANNNCGGK